MDANLERDASFRGRPAVALIGTHAGTGNAEQGRVLARLCGNAQNAVDAAATGIVLEVHLIDVDLIRAALGQQDALRVERNLARLVESRLPESVEILGLLGCRTKLLGREACRAESFVVFSVNVGRHLHAVESRTAHATRPLGLALFQREALLHVGIHHRSCLQVDTGARQCCARLEDTDAERGLLARLVVPVAMVGLNADGDIVASNLRTDGKEQQKSEK